MPSLLFHAFSFLAPVFYSSGPLPHARGRPSPTPPDRQPCAPLAIRGYNHAPRGASPLRLVPTVGGPARRRSEEHTSELQSLMRISYAVFCLNKNKHHIPNSPPHKNARPKAITSVNAHN